MNGQKNGVNRLCVSFPQRVQMFFVIGEKPSEIQAVGKWHATIIHAQSSLCCSLLWQKGPDHTKIWKSAKEEGLAMQISCYIFLELFELCGL